MGTAEGFYLGHWGDGGCLAVMRGQGKKGNGLGWRVWSVLVMQYLCESAGLSCYDPLSSHSPFLRTIPHLMPPSSGSHLTSCHSILFIPAAIVQLLFSTHASLSIPYSQH
ncbi:uncharacterized protein STEHIDRAFT_145998 [Stereum hirsutum FP-91666 SS1]|uniref:uncharacterized protein n=1 Tax=Stereum hirsutum (strain FP-91666) TaxID=721885 RepID=UPI000440E6DA|nr:uncharacterized protein STEHIDRAFT_145998 [Stereum hirsutum FP-91666 SS1]EIM87758.1 hypothetical protein STEHIDRAFT_145998 [Stereum hirsutum FP-91666 SS1]